MDSKDKVYKNMKQDEITYSFSDRGAALKISPKDAYERIKNGNWNAKTFEAWLHHVISDANLFNWV